MEKGSLFLTGTAKGESWKNKEPTEGKGKGKEKGNSDDG